MKFLLKIYLWTKIAVAAYLFVMACMSIYDQIDAGIIHGTTGYIIGAIFSNCITFFYIYYLSSSSYSELTNRKQFPTLINIISIFFGIIITIFFFVVPHPNTITIVAGYILVLIAVMDSARLIIKKPMS